MRIPYSVKKQFMQETGKVLVKGLEMFVIGSLVPIAQSAMNHLYEDACEKRENRKSEKNKKNYEEKVLLYY